MDAEEKSLIIEKIRTLNDLIRKMEDLSKIYNINIHDEKIYIAASVQRKILRDLLAGKI